MATVRHVLADSDGTLVDSVELIRRGQYEAAMSYLRELPLSELPSYDSFARALESVVGSSVRHTMTETLRQVLAAGPVTVGDLDVGEIVQRLDVVQDRLASSIVRPLPGVERFLTTVGANDLTLSVLTSGSRHHVVRNLSAGIPSLRSAVKGGATDEAGVRRLESAIAEQFGIRAVTVVTCQDVIRTKPDPECIDAALRRMQGIACQALYVGDGDADMAAALAAGVPSRIGVTTGFGDAKGLALAGATHVAKSLDEVLPYLQ